MSHISDIIPHVATVQLPIEAVKQAFYEDEDKSFHIVIENRRQKGISVDLR